MSQSDPAKSIRTFLAAALDPDLMEKLRQLQGQLQDGLGNAIVRWTRPDQLHLTLKFFGNVDSAQIPELIEASTRAALAHGGFFLELARLGCFPTLRNPRVIWVGIGGQTDRLISLQKALDQATAGLGTHQEPRDFHPHLTIGRTRPGGKTDRRFGGLLERTKLPCFGEWRIREVLLMQSTLAPHGSTYSVLARIPLGSEPERSTVPE